MRQRATKNQGINGRAATLVIPGPLAGRREAAGLIEPTGRPVVGGDFEADAACPQKRGPTEQVAEQQPGDALATGRRRHAKREDLGVLGKDEIEDEALRQARRGVFVQVAACSFHGEKLGKSAGIPAILGKALGMETRQRGEVVGRDRSQAPRHCRAKPRRGSVVSGALR